MHCPVPWPLQLSRLNIAFGGKGGSGGSFFIAGSVPRVCVSGGAVLSLLGWQLEPNCFLLSVLFASRVWRQRRGKQTEVKFFDWLTAERLPGFLHNVLLTLSAHRPYLGS